MKIRVFLVFILICSVLSAPVYANKPSLKDKLRSLFYTKTDKDKPQQVKTIPAGAACNPDVPQNCDVKK